jgi:ubiquinone/menaquinone biosynthesis C-methylase UbiE
MKHLEATGGLTSNDDEAAQRQKRSAQKFWQRYFNFYDTLNEAIPYRKMIERQAELLEPQPAELILDAGTGTGNVAAHLLASRAQVTGIDFCEPALELCRRKMPGGDFRFGDLTQPLEFASDHFDKIACCCVLHVLDRRAQRAVVRELFRVLKPGGRVVITAFAVGFSPIKVYLETLREQRRQGTFGAALFFALRYSFNTARILYYVARIKRREKSGEYNFFSRDEMVRMLEEAGFEISRVETAFADQCVTAVATRREQSLPDKTTAV